MSTHTNLANINTRDADHPFKFIILDRVVYAKTMERAIDLYNSEFESGTEDCLFVHAWDNAVHLYRQDYDTNDTESLCEYGSAIELVRSLGLATPHEVAQGL